jgi:kumamolisin
MVKPISVLKMIFSAGLSIATGFGAPELPQQLVAGRHGNLIVPESSVVRVEDYGLRAHTNHLILAPEAAKSMPKETEAEAEGAKPAAPFTPYGKSPAGLRTVYRLPASGGSGVIAVVDAYDSPSAEHDLGVFSSQFGLPPCTSANGCFRKVYASGSKPAASCSWAQEADLDIEWAHAMAPNAQILLVEAASNNSNDLARAVNVASSLVSPGGRGSGEVSMSWGFTEFSAETGFDRNFNQPGVVYVASSGDVGGQRNYPAVSPYVVAAGGTTLTYNSSGQFLSESAWSNGGGGPSTFESRPPYQNSIVSLVGSKRGTPDVSFDADPQSGVAMYDSTPCAGLSGWLVAGGTSLSSPAVAGIINLAGHFYASSDIELNVIYSHSGTTDFRDITSGQAGPYKATKGWDFATGEGSGLGTEGK